MTSEEKISDAHEKFCLAYIKNKGNGSLAYRAVFEVSAKTAKVNASKLLKKISIKKRIDELRDELSVREQIGIGEIIDYYKKIVSTNIFDYYEQDEKGRLVFKGRDKITKEQALMIDKIKITPHGVQLIMLDKMKAIDSLATFVGLKDMEQNRTPPKINLHFDQSLDDL